MTNIAIIPARYASTRFPGKPLIDIGGKPMIQRVYEQASRAKLDHVLVATDDRRIAAVVDQFGGNVVLTGDHPNGTARCMAAFQALTTSYDVLVNIQGDEPFVQPAQINALLSVFEAPEARIATLIKALTQPKQYTDPNIVKVAVGPKSPEGLRQALYFSRSPIPYLREATLAQALQERQLYRHIGLYAFHQEFVANYQSTVTPLSGLESLEQLTWLEQGHRIHVALTALETPAIDTPADLEHALAWLQAHPEH